MRAYVTSGDASGRRANQRHACALRLHATSYAELKARAHERREGLAQHTPPVGGDLWVWLG